MHTPDQNTIAPLSQPTLRASGNLLLGVVALELLVMQHHPTVSSHELGGAITQLHAVGPLAAWVHGILIALLLCNAACVRAFAATRNLDRLIIRLAWISYAAGIGLMIGAALVSGFVTANVVDLVPHTEAGDLRMTGALLMLCRLANQACAKAATFALCAGILLWSLELLRAQDAPRWLAWLGCAAGLLPMLGLLAAGVQLDVYGMTMVLWLLSSWTLGVAFWLRRLGTHNDTQLLKAAERG